MLIRTVSKEISFSLGVGDASSPVPIATLFACTQVHRVIWHTEPRAGLSTCVKRNSKGGRKKTSQACRTDLRRLYAFLGEAAERSHVHLLNSRCDLRNLGRWLARALGNGR